MRRAVFSKGVFFVFFEATAIFSVKYSDVRSRAVTILLLVYFNIRLATMAYLPYHQVLVANFGIIVGPFGRSCLVEFTR